MATAKKKSAKKKATTRAKTVATPPQEPQAPRSAQADTLTPQLLKQLLEDGIRLPSGETLVACALQPRHLGFLANMAKIEGRTLGNFLDRLVRLGYQADPSKGGTVEFETDTGYSGPAGKLPTP